jgi:hypothetical protein
MCFKVYSVFTVCGHVGDSEKEECATYSDLGTWERLTKSCKTKNKAVNFVFGWCPECKSYYFGDLTVGPRGEKVTHTFDSRDTMAIRRYWEHKHMSRFDTPVAVSKRIRFAVNPERDMAADTAKRAASSNPNHAAFVINHLRALITDHGEQLASYHTASDESQLTREEETLKSSLSLLCPSQVRIGPRRYSYPISNKKDVARMLHMVRMKTIAWANGDDKMYEEDVNLPLHWKTPYAPEVWRVTRKDAV